MSLNYYRDRNDITITELPGPSVTISCTAAPLEQSLLSSTRRRAILTGLLMGCVIFTVLTAIAFSAGLIFKGQSPSMNATCLGSFIGVSAIIAALASLDTFKGRRRLLQLSRQQSTLIEANPDVLTIESSGPYGDINETIKQRWIVDIVYVHVLPEEGEPPNRSADHWLQIQLIDNRDIWILPNRTVREYYRIILMLRRTLDLSTPVIQKSKPLL